jgi:hypothetical protein
MKISTERLKTFWLWILTILILSPDVGHSWRDSFWVRLNRVPTLDTFYSSAIL